MSESLKTLNVYGKKSYINFYLFYLNKKEDNEILFYCKKVKEKSVDKALIKSNNKGAIRLDCTT